MKFSCFAVLVPCLLWVACAEAPPAPITPAPDLPFALVAHGASEALGRIWVTGGYRGDADSRTFLSWAPPETAWRVEDPMPFDAHFHATCALDGALYVFGGSPHGDQAWRYDIGARRWRALAPMPTARNRMRAAEAGGFIYVVGGYGRTADGAGDVAACEAYDPRRDPWTHCAPMPTPRHGHAIVVAEGQIVVTGGSVSPALRAEVYDPASDRWVAAPDGTRASIGRQKPLNLLFHEATYWDGRVLHFGARDDAPVPIVAWRPHDGVWEVAAPTGPLRHRMASARLGPALYLIGGEPSAHDGPPALKDVVSIDLRDLAR